MATSETEFSGIIQETFSALRLLDSPKLAQVYTHVYHNGATEVGEIDDAVSIPKSQIYRYVNELTGVGLLERVSSVTPYSYRSNEIDIVVSDSSGTYQFDISPPLIEAIGVQRSNEAVAAYMDEHGVHGLAIALEYSKKRLNGAVTRRLMSSDLDIDVYEAEMILQELEEIIFRHGYDTRADGYETIQALRGRQVSHCLVDIGTIVACDRGVDAGIERLRRLSRDVGSSIWIPRSTYTELRQSNTAAGFEPPTDEIQTALDDGWLCIADPPDCTDPVAERAMNHIWTRLSTETGRHEIEIDRRDSVLGAVVSELDEQSGDPDVAVVDTERAVLDALRGAFERSDAHVSITSALPSGLRPEPRTE